MAQLSVTTPYVPLQQVTADNLNGHVTNAKLQPGAIHEQIVLGRTPVSSDELMIWDSALSVLRRTTLNDVLITGIPIITDSVTTPLIVPKANLDIIVNASNGANQTSKTFSSADGLNVTINSVAHALSVGSIVVVTASDTNYSGEFQVLTAATDSFTYKLPATVTVNAGSCSYYRKGAIRTKDIVLDGNEYISGNLEVVGNARTQGTARFDGSTTLNGNTNITGSFQINGTAGYVLTEVVQVNIPYATATAINSFNTVFTLGSIIKPADEIWEVSVNSEATVCTNDANGAFGLMSTSTITPIVFNYSPRFHYSNVANTAVNDSYNCSFVIPLGTVFGTVSVPESFRIVVRATSTAASWSIGTKPTSAVAGGGVAGNWNQITIKKFKTA